MTHIKQRRDTAANWTAENPILFIGEVGWETDTLKAKLGDGVTAWNSLAYAVSAQVISVAGKTGVVLLDKTDVGLANVNNTSDASKPISSSTQTALDAKAPIASPTFTGDPKAPTPTAGDNDTSIATTAFVTTAVASKAPTASPTFTGNPTGPTPAAGDNDTSLATTAFVQAEIAPAFTDVTFNGSWTNFGSPYEEVSYTKIGNRVFLRGLAKHATPSQTGTIFTLPAGYRPVKDKVIRVGAGNGSANIVITASTGALGIAAYINSGDASSIVFDSISFDIAA